MRFARLRLEGWPAREGGGLVVQPFIDDHPLVGLVRTTEYPFAKAEGHADLAGKYDGLPLSVIAWPSAHLLGAAVPMYSWNGLPALLDCECQTPGCWPLVCRIEVARSIVTWSAFYQPHRMGRRGSVWSYDELGPFQFRLKEYLEALREEQIRRPKLDLTVNPRRRRKKK